MAIIRLQSDIERQKGSIMSSIPQTNRWEKVEWEKYIKVGVWTNGQVCIRK